MSHSLAQVKKFCDGQEVPFVVAGDLFDKWNPPPELIEFAIRQLPKQTYTIPGQHDLPNHNYELRHKSAYGVLAAAGRITDIPSNIPYMINGVIVWACPWEHEIKASARRGGHLEICVAHQYLWIKQHSYPGANPQHNVNQMGRLKRFDASFFGDNHKGFILTRRGTTVMNCGGFMRRKSDEQNYQPCVGLLYEDGSVERWALDTTKDHFVRNAELDKLVPEVDMDEFISEMKRLGDVAIDFPDHIKRYIANHDLPVNVSEALEKLIVPF